MAASEAPIDGEAKGKGKRQKPRERGGNPGRPGLLRWQAKRDGWRVAGLEKAPRGEGHLPVADRSEWGKRQHQMNLVSALVRKRPPEEMTKVFDMMTSIDTLDTFQGYQGQGPNSQSRPLQVDVVHGTSLYMTCKGLRGSGAPGTSFM